MWILGAILSAALLGFYDVFKKYSLKGNAVLPVLMVTTSICALFFLPLIISSLCGWSTAMPVCGTREHLLVLAKAVLVLSSWVCGYYAMKHLPLTIVGPINATRPIFTLLGALLLYGERLNGWQWAGVWLSVASFYLLSRSGKKEGIRFGQDRWVLLLVLAALLGGISGLYDKFLLAPSEAGGMGLNRYFVQAWYNTYQALMMVGILLLIWWPARSKQKFKWRWSILLIPIFLTGADLVYFYALSLPGALIAVVSMVRRSCVVVSFLFGALLFREKNLRGKSVGLLLVILGTVCLFIGSIHQ